MHPTPLWMLMLLQSVRRYDPIQQFARFAKPINKNFIFELKKYDYIFTAEENVKSGGFAENLKNTAEKLFSVILKNNLQNKIDENTLTCLMFCDDYEEMLRVCNYFNVDPGCVENAKYMLNIS